MDLPKGSYLILISQASLVGEILKCHVFRVEALLFIPLTNPIPPFNVQPDDRPFIDMIQNL